MAQYKNPTHGDWVSSYIRDLKYLNINLTFDNITDTPLLIHNRARICTDLPYLKKPGLAQ